MFLTTLLALAPLTALPDEVGTAVLQDGDVLSNGWEVDAIQRPAIADSGAWVALVGTTQSGSTPDNALVTTGGAVVLAEGDTLPSGFVLENLLDFDLDAGGHLAVLGNVANPPGAVLSQLFVDGVLATRTGIVANGVGVPVGTRIFSMDDVELAYPHLFVRAKLSTNGGLPFEAFLHLELQSGGAAPLLEVLAFEGGTLLNGAGPNGSAFHSSAIASDGSYIATLGQDVAGSSGTTVGFRNGSAFYVENAASPITGTTWRHQTTPAVAKAPGASFAFSSTLRESSGAVRGIVIANNQILAYEGQSVLGNPGLTVANFSEVAVALAADGSPVFKLPTTTGSVIMAFDEVIAEATADTVGGVAIASTKTGTEQSLDVTSDGNQVLAEVELVGGVSALVLIERRVGTITPCTPNPNSTGVPGRLFGIGQSFLAANDLTIIAYDLPPNVFGHLGCSRTPTFVPNPAGSAGNLCLGGQVGRYDDQIALSGPLGIISTTIDMTAIPHPTGVVPGLVGQVWGFQLWHRDVDATGNTSNFTETLAVQLR